MQIPIAVQNRRKISLKATLGVDDGVRGGGDVAFVAEEVKHFCKWNHLPPENVPTLVRSVLKGANPTAFQL